MMHKLPKPDRRDYSDKLGRHSWYWNEVSAKAIQEEAYRAGMAAERERCEKLRTVAGQVLIDMQAQGVLIEWQTLLEEGVK